MCYLEKFITLCPLYSSHFTNIKLLKALLTINKKFFSIYFRLYALNLTFHSDSWFIRTFLSKLKFIVNFLWLNGSYRPFKNVEWDNKSGIKMRKILRHYKVLYKKNQHVIFSRSIRWKNLIYKKKRYFFGHKRLIWFHINWTIFWSLLPIILHLLCLLFWGVNMIRQKSGE